MQAFDVAISQTWGMTEEALQNLLSIAAREHEVTPVALEAYRAQALARADRATRRGDTAILAVNGPLFRRANLMVEFSGATSYEILRRDFQVAMDDPGVSSILLSIDSPGGELHGTGELARAIFEARDKKRVVAYVSGQASSAAYWIASAASEIIMDPSAVAGSIGVLFAVKDTTKQDEARGVKNIQFVSSQSPNKRPDFETDAGKATVQATVDALGEVFIEAVATNRGVTPDKVAKDFGRGGVLVGAGAVAADMADRIGTFESVLADLSKNGGSNRGQRSGGLMSNAAETVTKADHDAAVASARADGAKNERTRIQAIMTSEGAKANADQAEHLAYGTELASDVAIGILAKAAPAAPVVEGQAGYAEQRAAAAGLASPKPVEKPNAQAAAAGWDDAVSRTNGARKSHVGH